MPCTQALRLLLVAVVLTSAAVAAPLSTAQACPPEGYTEASLFALKASGFAVADSGQRTALALALRPCLADPNPTLRDGLSFEAYSRWMRGALLSEHTLRILSADLQAQLTPAAPEGEGFAKPFAALVLAEVARTDRITPWMSAMEREHMLVRATTYLRSVRDYRGWDERQGWRHGIAHTADWLMQLALNPALDKAQLQTIADAIATQVPAYGGHAYVFGVPERLAAPVLYIARRKLHSAQEWQAWLAALCVVPEGAAAQDVFQSQKLLAWRHNTQAFLYALYVNLAMGSDADLKLGLMPAVATAIQHLP